MSARPDEVRLCPRCGNVRPTTHNGRRARSVKESVERATCPTCGRLRSVCEASTVGPDCNAVERRPTFALDEYGETFSTFRPDGSVAIAQQCAGEDIPTRIVLSAVKAETLRVYLNAEHNARELGKTADRDYVERSRADERGEKIGEGRDRASGQYTHAIDRLCLCGHTLGVHAAASVGGERPCFVTWPDVPHAGCPCVKFKPAKKPRAAGGTT